MGWKDKISDTEFILRETRARFKNPCQLWSTGKDSTADLHIAKQLFGELPWPAVFLETGYHPKEMIDFRDRIAEEWGFDLIRYKNPDARSTPEKSRLDCCHKRKTLALRRCIEEYGFDAVIVSIRWDEEAIRSKERVMSPRDERFRWLFAEKGGPEGVKSLQDTEIHGIYMTEFEGCHHVRVHPLLNWFEHEVWEYVVDHKLPVNPLYFRGYRSLGCEPCTVTVMTPSKSVREIAEKVKKSKTGERSGRSQDKEMAMERLRAWGYM